MNRLPCTPLQANMFYAQLMAPASTAANEQLLVELCGEYDHPRMQRAFRALVWRHPVLRTRFGWSDDDEPLQCIVDHPDLPHTVVKATAMDLLPTSGERWLDSWAAAIRSHAFDLEQAPPLRLDVAVPARPYGARFALLLTFHHILLDGRSYPIVLRDLLALYDGERLTPPTEGMRVYAEWHGKQRWESAVAAWRDYLKPPTLLSDSGGREAPEIRPFRAVHDEKNSAAITRECAERKLSLATVLFAAWALTLRREAGGSSPEVVFGYTHHGRTGLPFSLEGAVGLFINTVPLVIGIDDTMSVQEFLGTVKASMSRMRSHVHTPYPDIARASPTPVLQPLFDSIVVFDHGDIESCMAGHGRRWETARIRNLGTTSYPATVIGFGGRAISVGLDIDLARIPLPKAERIFGNLLSCLHDLIWKPDASLADVGACPQARRQQAQD